MTWALLSSPLPVVGGLPNGRKKPLLPRPSMARLRLMEPLSERRLISNQ